MRLTKASNLPQHKQSGISLIFQKFAKVVSVATFKHVKDLTTLVCAIVSLNKIGVNALNVLHFTIVNNFYGKLHWEHLLL